MLLYLAPDGEVRPCCRNTQPLGNIAWTSLLDIWRGEDRRLLQEHLDRQDFSLGCTQCQGEVEVEGRSASYPANFDEYESAIASDPTQRWPLRMEFNLSNTCNLQCIQCDGFLSSSIRLHRDQKPPLPKVYGDGFFADLEHFIPHLREAQFAGGEPFMAAENYRVWDLIERLNPRLTCLAVTNATQWSARVERVINTLDMGFIFSLDGVVKETYEPVRIGADFDVVMANVERYVAVARSRNALVEVNHCLMVQNHEGFADVLRWAEDRQMKVNVSVVRNPPACSLAALDDDELRAVVERYERQSVAVVRDLTINRKTWIDEVARLRRWLEAGAAGRRDVWWESAEQLVDGEVAVGLSPRRDLGELVRDFKAAAGDQVMYEFVLSHDDRILELSEPLVELARSRGVDLVGGRTADADGLFEEVFGARTFAQAAGGPEVPGVVAQEVTFGATVFRLLGVPIKREDQAKLAWSFVLHERGREV